MDSFIKNEGYFSDIERILRYAQPEETNEHFKGMRDEKKALNIEKLISSALPHINTGFKEDEIERALPLVTFDRVSVPYPKMNMLALRSVSFSIMPKERVAIIGLSGSGKHSIITLISGFHPAFNHMEGKLTVLNGSKDFDIIEQNSIGMYCLENDYHMINASLRRNLDPLRKYHDLDIVKVLAYLRFWDMPTSYMLEKKQEVAKITELLATQVLPADIQSNKGMNTSLKLSFHKHDSIYQESKDSGRRRLAKNLIKIGKAKKSQN